MKRIPLTGIDDQVEILQHPAFVADTEDDPPDIELLNVIADLGGIDESARLNVYRATAERGLKGGAFLYSCLPADFSREELLRNYGAGQYRVHVRSAGRILRNVLITLEEARNSDGGSLVKSQSVGELTHISKLIEAMQTGFGQLSQLIVQVNQVPQFDPNEARRSLLQDMLSMKQILGTDNNQNNADKSIEMVMKGIELAREITPRDGATSSMDILLEGLKTFGKPIAEATLARMNQPMHAPIEQPVPLASLNAVQNPPHQLPMNSPLSEDEKMSMMLKMYASQLVNQAKNERDPYVYANLLLDSLPEDRIDQLTAMSDAQLFGFIQELNPEAANYKLWMLEFIDQVREILTPDMESVNKMDNADISNIVESPIFNNGDVKSDPQR